MALKPLRCTLKQECTLKAAGDYTHARLYNLPPPPPPPMRPGPSAREARPARPWADDTTRAHALDGRRLAARPCSHRLSGRVHDHVPPSP